MGLYQRRAEILRPTQNDRHFLLSLVYGCTKRGFSTVALPFILPHHPESIGT